MSDRDVSFVLDKLLHDALAASMKKVRLPSPPHNPFVGQLVAGKREASQKISAAAIRAGFREWRENGYLPHRDGPGLVQFITFRLADAFPEALRTEWQALLQIEDDRKRQIQLQRYLDLGRGECALRRAEIAAVVESSLLYWHDTKHEMLAWVIMPNHVHLLCKIRDVPMSILLDAWKGYTAKAANRLLGRTGQFWQEGYWDTFMRNTDHELRSRRYIENNPVRARLTAQAKNWKWSSARYRDAYGRLCLPSPAPST